MAILHPLILPAYSFRHCTPYQSALSGSVLTASKWHWRKYRAHAEAYGSHYALQCGACTPGFVTSTHAAIKKCHLAGKQPTVEEVQQGLDGNLCRCTGYPPHSGCLQGESLP